MGIIFTISLVDPTRNKRQWRMSTVSSEYFACLMTMMMDHMLHERDNMVGVDKAIESIVNTNGHFNEKMCLATKRITKWRCG